MSRCFVGCLGQARKRYSNRCCCGPRNYTSDVPPTDPLAPGIESPSQTLALGVVFCTATARLKYKKNQPFDRGGSSLVRRVPMNTPAQFCERSTAAKKRFQKPAHCHGSLLLRLVTHQRQNRTRDAHKISPRGTMTKRQP